MHVYQQPRYDDAGWERTQPTEIMVVNTGADMRTVRCPRTATWLGNKPEDDERNRG